MIVNTGTETVDFTALWKELLKWWDDEALVRVASWPQRRKGLLLGGPVYGEKYITAFINYCLPSMFSGANLEALKGSALVLFTDKPGVLRLSQLKPHLHAHGVDVLVKIIPDEVMKCIRHPMDHMWIMGTIHQMAMKEAGHMGYDWNMLVADAVYGDGYFANLMRLGTEHGAVVQHALTATTDEAVPLIDKYRDERGLIIPQADLGTIGWQCLHLQKKPLVMTGRTDFAVGSWLIYEGQEMVSIYGPWTHISFLSNELCVVSPTILPATVDTQVLELTPKGRYIPKAEDGLCVVDLSGPEKLSTADEHLFMAEWCNRMWDRMKFKAGLMEIFSVRCEVPVRGAAGLPASSIEQLQRAHVEYLLEHRAEAALAWCERELR